MRKYASFDLEIAQQLPPEVDDWSKYGPLGITCAAIALEDDENPIIYQGKPRMSQEACRALVAELDALTARGYTILTWNGCKFDFRILAEESLEIQTCARQASEHVDMMLMFTFQQGHYLSLQAALEGAGLKGKLKSVRLNDGSTLQNMDGSQAPRLWAQGEYQAVLDYLVEDVRQPIQLARAIERSRAMSWTSRRGGSNKARFDRLYTVRESFGLPKPDTSWMRNAPQRAEFISWMPGGALPE